MRRYRRRRDIDIAGASNGIWNAARVYMRTVKYCWYKNVDQTPGSGDGNGNIVDKAQLKRPVLARCHIADIDDDATMI
jgi:hypothetical protein